MPEKAPELIAGVLRQGHKGLLSGASKAGKSFMLIELCIAIAEGKQWLGRDCAQGKVLYVNMELDEASAFHRFKDVYKALGIPPENLNNIDIWNLRGKTAPMDKLAPKLIRRAEKQNYIAVLIDPIYKVLTGDENSAEDMAHFTNQFDKIASELKSAVIYCHHHSKGSQGGKRSMDRASGSGVFARDPDAILDLTELEITEGLLRQQQDEAVCRVYERWFREKNQDYLDEYIGRDDLYSVAAMYDHSKRGLKKYLQEVGIETLQAAEDVKKRSAWRVEGTLREFARLEPINIWFDFPIHKVDDTELLKKAEPESEKPFWQKGADKNKKKKKTRLEKFEDAFNELEIEGNDEITTGDIAQKMNVTQKTVKNYIEDHEDFYRDYGKIYRKNDKVEHGKD